MGRQQPTTPEERQRIVAEWTASGLSAAAFAEAHGMAMCTLYGWRRQLRARSTGRVDRGAAPAFAEVVLRSSEADAHRAGAEPPSIELVIADVVVRVGAAFDDAHLRRVVDVLRRTG